jgi:hypothetical protein
MANEAEVETDKLLKVVTELPPMDCEKLLLKVTVPLPALYVPLLVQLPETVNPFVLLIMTEAPLLMVISLQTAPDALMFG